MTEEQIKIELRKINEGEDWNSLFNYIMLLEQDIRNLIAQRDEREKETIKLKKDIVKATTNWNELKKWLGEQADYLTKIDGQNIPLKDSFEFCSMNELYQTGKYSGFKESLEKMQEMENGKDD